MVLGCLKPAFEQSEETQSKQPGRGNTVGNTTVFALSPPKTKAPK